MNTTAESTWKRQYRDGKMVFAGSSGTNRITIMDETLSYKTVNPGIMRGLPSLVEGENDTVVYLGDSPVVQDGGQFARAMIIDVDSGDAVERLLPAPRLEEDGLGSTLPGEKYGLIFIGVSPDLKQLYYSYQTVEKAGDNVFHTRLGMFDTEREKDLPYVYDGCCPPMGGYTEYGGYLMVSHFPEAGGSALLLNMKDLSSVVDWTELLKGETTSRLTIHPFGKYFIVGTDSKVLLLSQGGALLKEYPLPAELIGRGYTIVEYRGK